MSSILDALNKAEEDRTAAEEAMVRGFKDLDIEGELTGRSPSNDGPCQGFALTPLKVLVLGIGLIAVIALVSGAAAMAVLYLGNDPGRLPVSARPAGQEPHVAAAAPSEPLPETRTTVRPALPAVSPESTEAEPPETDPAPDAPKGTAEAAPPVNEEPAAEEPLAPASVPGEGAELPSKEEEEVTQAAAPPWEPDNSDIPEGESSAPETAVSESAPQVSVPPSEPEPAVPTPRLQVASAAPPEHVEPTSSETSRPSAPTYPDTTPLPEPVPPQPARTEDTTLPKAVSPGEVDILSLPELTDSARRRLRLPEITVNVVGRPSKYRPQPSAMINFNRVVLNEFIPGTDARLIGVSVHGIGIQVGQERYFVPK
jgi:hypothetical protein